MAKPRPIVDAAFQTFTVNDLMVRWRCRRKLILEAIRDHRLAAFRIGKRVYRVTADEVARFENSSTGI